MRALLYVAMTRGRLANYAYITLAAAGTHRPPHVPETGQRTQRRSADLRPGISSADSSGRPGQDSPDDGEPDDSGEEGAPASRADQEAPAPWAPEADRLSVLTGILKREDIERPALDVLRDELARVRHLAHLGAIWIALAAEESGRRYDATLRQVLTDEQYERLASEEARSTLYRQVRTAELAGHDARALLAQAVRLRSLDGDEHRGRAESISQVLHSRVRELIGDPVPRPASYAEHPGGRRSRDQRLPDGDRPAAGPAGS
jgi:hypothetical protein